MGRRLWELAAMRAVRWVLDLVWVSRCLWGVTCGSVRMKLGDGLDWSYLSAPFVYGCAGFEEEFDDFDLAIVGDDGAV